jgi:hypothetical protein
MLANVCRASCSPIGVIPAFFHAFNARATTWPRLNGFNRSPKKSSLLTAPATQLPRGEVCQEDGDDRHDAAACAALGLDHSPRDDPNDRSYTDHASLEVDVGIA